MSIFDNRGGLKWIVCRERGNLAVFDGDCKELYPKVGDGMR